MGKLKIQFDKDDAIDIVDVEDNQPFNFVLQKTGIDSGTGMKHSQDSAIITFTDGDKTFKIWIE